MTTVAPRHRAVAPPTATSGRSRLLVVVADQAVNSITNVVVVLVVAAAVPLREFGVFAAATVAVQLAQSIAAAGIGDRLLQAAPERRGRRYASGARLLDLLTLGTALLAVAVTVGIAVSPWVIAAVLAPALARIDYWRVRTVAYGHPGTALLVDVVLGVVQVAGVVAWWRIGTPRGVAGAVMVCAVAALVTVLALVVHDRARTGGARESLADAVSVRYGVEMAAVNGSGQIAQLVVTAQLGFAFSGTLRAAQVPFGIVVVLVLAARAVLIPAMRDGTEEHARRLARLAALAAVVVAALFTVFTLVVTAVAPLRFLVGGVQLQTAFVVLLGAGYAAVAGGMVQTYYLRARHRDREVSVGRGVMLGLLALGTGIAVITHSAWVFLAALAVSWAASSVVMALVTPHSRPSR